MQSELPEVVQRALGTWRLRAGEHWAVLGGNGAGKSTFLRQVALLTLLAQLLAGWWLLSRVDGYASPSTSRIE